jgi:hypothetical protein
VIYALHVIGSTAGLVLLALRLGAVQEGLDRVGAESGDRDQAAREECSAYAHGVTMALACLLTGLAAWYAPPQPTQEQRMTGIRRGRQDSVPLLA